MPDAPDTPGPDPMCFDANAGKWVNAWVHHQPPPAGAVGLMYMLEGGTDASNTDPYATKPTAENNWITTGPQAKAFEAALSSLCGGRPVRAFNSGTVTLEVGLRLAGVGPGDEVLTPPLSWVATANVVLEVGARPVFVDVDPRTRNIDLELLEKNITSKTKALIPVDLAGLSL